MTLGGVQSGINEDSVAVESPHIKGLDLIIFDSRDIADLIERNIF